MSVSARCRRVRARTSRSRTGARRRCDADVDARELVGSRDAKVGSGCVHARDRVSKIVILRKGGMDQFLQPFVFEDLKPFQIGERVEIGRRRSFTGAAESIRRIDGRPSIVGSHLTAHQEAACQRSNNPSLLHVSCLYGFS